jgi:NAD(P)H-dependent FMN reductase
MKVLVIYYSRSGRTRRVAALIAEALRAREVEVVVEELKDKQPRQGLGGLLGACVDATFGRKTQIRVPEARVEDFDVVVLGTPIWAWAGTPAAMAFCRDWGRRAKRTALFCTMMGPTAGGTFKALSSELRDEPLAALALSHRQLGSEETLKAAIKSFAESITS